MATKTIGGAGDYTTIAAWSAYVKAIGTLTEDEVGQLIDDANYARSATSDLDFSGVTLSGFTITMLATTNKHDGDFGNGTRVEADVSFGGMYQPRQLIMEDLIFHNTQTSSGGARVFIGGLDIVCRRVLGKTDSTGGNSTVFTITSTAGSSSFEACRSDGGTAGFVFAHGAVDISNCTAVNATIGFSAVTVANTGTAKNNVAYNCGTDWSGTWSGTYTNNASEDGTHPGTAGVTISGDPFDADGYTPASSGQLDGAGVDLSIALDAANNSYNATPSIGAYESISAGGATGSGSHQAEAATSAGIAERTIKGSGSPQALTALSSGIAERIITGSGSPQAETATSVGTVERVVVGSGSHQATTAISSGVGIGGGVSIGSGAHQANTAISLGIGERKITGIGDNQAAYATSTGVALRVITGSGAHQANTATSFGTSGVDSISIREIESQITRIKRIQNSVTMDYNSSAEVTQVKRYGVKI